MLKLPRSHHFSLPNIRHGSQPMMLSEPGTENDELIESIENDHISRGNDWTLTGDPDVMGLEKFWSKVQNDISGDPGWFQFIDD